MLYNGYAKAGVRRTRASRDVLEMRTVITPMRAPEISLEATARASRLAALNPSNGKRRFLFSRIHRGRRI